MVSGAEGSCHPQLGPPCFHSSKESPQGNRPPFPRDTMKKNKSSTDTSSFHTHQEHRRGAGISDAETEAQSGGVTCGGHRARRGPSRDSQPGPYTSSGATLPLPAESYSFLPRGDPGGHTGRSGRRLRGRGTQSREPRSGVKASRPLGVLTGSDFCFKSAAAMGCGLGAGRSSIRGLGLSSGQSARWQRGQKREKAPARAIPREEPGPDASSFVPHHSQGPELRYKTGHSTGQTLQPGPSPTLLR